MLELLALPVAEAIAGHCQLPVARVRPLVAPPTRADAGDLAVPCFVLAKERGQPPPQLASELAEVVAAAVPGCSASAAGPFLNLRFAPASVAALFLPALRADPVHALRLADGEGRTVCIDFSSPNIAKHLAFHHIRSTMLGNALAHCYAAGGWRSVRINFLGDWGTAFGRLIAGWKREGLSLADLEAAADKVDFLNQLYVRISRAADADPAVMEEARHWSKALEDGDAEARELWQIFKDASLVDFHRIYELLDVTFDSWKGEAFYESRLEGVLAELAGAGLLIEDQGAQVVDLSARGFKKPVLIQRADGGTLYATRDLAACQDRFEEFGFDRALYVVDLGQNLHFREWFAVAGELGKPYAERLRHVGFGVVLMYSEEDDAFVKGKTRSGRVVLLEDVLRESIARAEAIIAEKNPELAGAERAAVARAVGVGAVIFNDLKNSRTTDVKFRFDEALNMQGDTGPYLQYTHARLCSIERRFAETLPEAPDADTSLIAREDEKAVLLAIGACTGALRAVLENDEPHHLAGALLDLAAATSSWLTAGTREHEARVVLSEQPALSAARTALVAAARATLGEGLRLLGIRAPERM